jgi:hypothetical protein
MLRDCHCKTASRIIHAHIWKQHASTVVVSSSLSGHQQASGCLQAVAGKRADVDKVATVRGGLSSTLGIRGTLNRTLLDSQQYKEQLASHKGQQLERFEELLRLRVANPKSLRQSVHLQPFHEVCCMQEGAPVKHGVNAPPCPPEACS